MHQIIFEMIKNTFRDDITCFNTVSDNSFKFDLKKRRTISDLYMQKKVLIR